MKLKTIPLFFLLILIACFDNATVHQTLNDLTTDDPYAGMVLIPAGAVTTEEVPNALPEEESGNIEVAVHTRKMPRLSIRHDTR